MPLPTYGNEQQMILGVGGLTSVLTEREGEFVAAMQEAIAIHFKKPLLLPEPLLV
jgi:hypothetical protein